jgi:hypothetical protein
LIIRSRYNDLATGRTTEESGFDSWRGEGIFLFPINIPTASWAQPTSYGMGTRGNPLWPKIWSTWKEAGCYRHIVFTHLLQYMFVCDERPSVRNMKCILFFISPRFEWRPCRCSPASHSGTRFISSIILVGFVVVKVALGRGFLQAFLVSLACLRLHTDSFTTKGWYEAHLRTWSHPTPSSCNGEPLMSPETGRLLK